MKKWVIAVVVAGVLGLAGVLALSISKVWPAAETVAVEQTRKPAPATLLEQPVHVADLAALRRSAERTPNDAAAQSRLGDAHLAATNFTDAIAAYRRALAIDPNRAADWSALGEAYVQTVRSTTPALPPPARAAFDRALALDPSDLRSQFYLIMEKDFTGQHEQAVNAWLTMLARVPKDSQADKAIRAAITASVGRNMVLLRKRIETATKAQRAAAPAKAKS